jgi:hypothetical protein
VPVADLNTPDDPRLRQQPSRALLRRKKLGFDHAAREPEREDALADRAQHEHLLAGLDRHAAELQRGDRPRATRTHSDDDAGKGVNGFTATDPERFRGVAIRPLARHREGAATSTTAVSTFPLSTRR